MNLVADQITGEILALEIMKEYGWTWQEYRNTPAYVIRMAEQKMQIERKKAADKARAENQ